MRLIIGLLLFTSAAWATVFTEATGTLNATALTATGSTPDVVQADGASGLLIYGTGTAGTMTAKCQQSGDGVNWADSGGTTTSALGPVCNVLFPTGFYRATLTVCTGCSLTFRYKATTLR